MPAPFFTPEKINTFRALVQAAKHAAIVTHVNPDGDAIGTSMALRHCLQSRGIETTVIVPNLFPDFLHWLDEDNAILVYRNGHTKPQAALAAADIIFCVDFNNLERIDELGKFIAGTPAPRVLIDHHLQPEEAAFAVSFSKVEACSSAEVLYHLLIAMDWLPSLSAPAAEAIYTGIMTDTNSFRNNSSRPETFYAVAELLKLGINKDKAYAAVYNNYSSDRMRLLGYALGKMEVMPHCRTAYIALTKEELTSYSFRPGDTEGFVNYPLHIKGIVCSAFMLENAENIRLSFRSFGAFSVNEFARKHFDGGGHLNAAGGISKQSLPHTIEKFIQSIQACKDELAAV
jgi:phosphoesterase RecJ-like protein